MCFRGFKIALIAFVEKKEQELCFVQQWKAYNKGINHH